MNRPLAVAACCLLLAAACGADDPQFEAGEGSTTTGQEASASSPGGPGSTVAAGASTTKPPGSATTKAESPRTTTTRTAPPTTANVDPPPGDDGSHGGPGDFARTILRPGTASTVVIERFEQKGAEPRPASLEHARAVLQSVSTKSTTVTAAIALTGGARSWSADELRSTADSASKAGQGQGKAVVHVLFLRGTFDGNDDVLGVAVRGDVVAIFSDAVASSATPLVPRSEIEAAVLVHELGHVLGLVDLARNTGRADPDHPGHSKNEKSVMFWAVESSLVGQVLTGPPPRDFDQQDLADLRALREGA